MDGALPLYKGKESSGFASRTGRSEIANGKSKKRINQDKNSKTTGNINFELNAGSNEYIIPERSHEEENYIEVDRHLNNS